MITDDTNRRVGSGEKNTNKISAVALLHNTEHDSLSAAKVGHVRVSGVCAHDGGRLPLPPLLVGHYANNKML